jgi:hypothetical protein
LASISVEIFYKFFNSYEIELELKSSMDKELRKSYFGGRCEVFGNFYKENEKIYYFDFKNMYAQIMQEYFPTGEIYLEKSINNINKSGFYYVLVECFDFDIPILPYRAVGFDKNSV